MEDAITAYIGVGTNMGDKEANIRQALEMISQTPGVSLNRTASIYKTEPVGFEDQDWFLNTVVEITTELPPLALLEKLLAIESRMGRVRTIHWGPRVIDLDIVLYGDMEIDTPQLTVPHPRMAERAFVLAPLAELKPELELKGLGRVSKLAGGLTGRQGICLYDAKKY